MTTSLHKARTGRDLSPSSLLIWHNTHTSEEQIYHSTKRGPPHFFIWISFLYLDPSSFILDKIHVLVVTAELISLFFLNILSSTLFQHRTNLLGSQDSKQAMKTTMLSFLPPTGIVTLSFILMCTVQSAHVSFFLQLFFPSDSAFA